MIFFFYSWFDYVIVFLGFIELYLFRGFFYFSDIICDLGGVKDFVNYGEYLGVFSE